MTFRDMKFAVYAAAFFAVSICGFQANALTVSATSSVTFEFDVTVWPQPTDLSTGTFGNNSVVSCFNTPDPCLAFGKSIRLNVSNTIGGDELGSRTMTNTTSIYGTTGYGGGIFGAVPLVVPNTSLLYITFAYVDDDYDVEFFTNLRGYAAVGLPVITSLVDGKIVSSVVPLPAALPLFGSALGVLGLLGWRRKRIVAA